ncbi:hypothetical protein EHS25_000524, partial [Saitozyma podzolica]
MWSGVVVDKRGGNVAQRRSGLKTRDGKATRAAHTRSDAFSTKALSLRHEPEGSVVMLRAPGCDTIPIDSIPFQILLAATVSRKLPQWLIDRHTIHLAGGRRGEADIPGRAMQAPDDPDESDQSDLHTQIASLTETVSTLQTEVEEKRLEVAVLTTMTDSLANAFIRLGSQVESLRNHFESSSEGFARDIQYLKRQLRPPS